MLSRPQAANLDALEPITLEGARERFGHRISEEELMLRLTMPAEQVDAMVRARRTASAAATTSHRSRAPVVSLLKELAARPSISHFELVKGTDRVVWSRGG